MTSAWHALKRSTEISAGFGPDLLRALRGRPSSADTYRLTRLFHDLTAGRSSAALTSLYRRLPGSADRIDEATRTRLRAIHQQHLTELERTGVVVVPPVLDAKQIAALVEFARTAPASIINSDGQRVNGTYADRGSDARGIRISGTFLWTRPEVQELLVSSPLADFIMATTGLRATVHPPQLFWTCAAPQQTPSETRRRLAQRYHCDFDGLAGMRLHLYLTDVDDGAAPMQYVHGSHRTGVLPIAYRQRHNDDVPLDEVHRRFGSEAATSITGPAGTTFVSRSQGLHSGTPPVTADRLFLVMSAQAGAFSGAFNRRRSVPVTNPAFGAALAAGAPELRLFEAIEATGKLPVARMAAAS
jgi:hypothetical protein